jgi:hypothetical protein
MQPRFPDDHHFHDRRRPPARHLSGDELRLVADRAATYLARQCLPAFDPSDPRGPLS